MAVSGVGLGTFIYPPIIRSLVHSFGNRGTLLITGGVTLNLCVCGALMRPPRRQRISGSEDQYPEKGDRAKSEPSTSPLHSRSRYQCLSLLNLYMFKDVGFLVLCVNSFFASFGLNIVYVHLVAYSVTKDINKDAAAMAISAVGIANFVARPLFGLFGNLRRGPVMLYALSYSLCGLVVVCIPLMEHFISIMITSAAFGFLSASAGPLLPLIITDFLSVELLPSAFGYLMTCGSIGSLLGPPSAGKYRNVNEESVAVHLAFYVYQHLEKRKILQEHLY